MRWPAPSPRTPRGRWAGAHPRAFTANVHGVRLITADTADLAIIDDLVEVQAVG
ncbi:MAG: hypothetical protein LC799_26770 [Actinobacteria bacterium]|nr:hypothetical protein [Actinomycetota bacterium]